MAIKADFTLWQWDTNRSVTIDSGDRVHFAHEGDETAYVIVPEETDGVLTAAIPDELLQSASPIMAFAASGGNTTDSTYLSVTARPRPNDYAYTPTDKQTISELDAWMREQFAALEANANETIANVEASLADSVAAVDNANAAVEAANQAVEAANEAEEAAGMAAASANAAAQKALDAAKSAHYNVLTNTVSGDVVSGDDAFPVSPRRLAVYGNTRQNLWSNDWTNHTGGGMVIEENPDGTIHVDSSECTINNPAGRYVDTYVLKPGSKYVAFADKSLGNTTSNSFLVHMLNESGTPIQSAPFGYSVDGEDILSTTFVCPEGTVSTRMMVYAHDIAAGVNDGDYRVMLYEAEPSENLWVNPSSEALPWVPPAGYPLKPWCPPGIHSVGELMAHERNLWVNPSGTMNGVTVTANADGTFTVSGTSTVAGANVTTVEIHTLKPNTQYTLSSDTTFSNAFYPMVNPTVDGLQIGSIAALNNRNTFTFTTPAEFDFVRCLFYVVDSGTPVSGTYRVMLNKGDTAMPWVPPGTESAVRVVTAGKNLCQIPPIEDAFVWVSYSPVVDEVNKTIDILNSFKGVPLTATCTVTMRSADDASKIPNSRVGIIVQTANHGRLTSQQTWGSGAAIGTTKTIVYKFTVPEDAVVTNFYMYGCGSSNVSSIETNGNVDMKIQIEIGDESTAYEPPNMTTVPVDLQGNELCSLPDGTRDVLDVVTGKISKALDKKVLNGEEQWEERTISSYGVYFIINKSGEYTTGAKAACDSLPVSNPYNTPGECFYAYGTTGGVELRIRINGVSTVEGLKSYLSSNPITVVYENLSDQTIQLTPPELPPLAPTWSMWVQPNANGVPADLEVTYERDMNIAYDKLVQAITATAAGI